MNTSLQNDKSQHSLSWREKFCYGLGDVSNGLAVSTVSFFLLKYLTDVAGIGAQAAGIAVMVGRVWDAVTDPLMGWITDNTKSRWGKRRPYLLFGAIPYAIAYFALWSVPEFEKEIITFAYVTVALLIFNTCLTVVFVPYTSLTAAMTSDYDERTSLTGFRMVSSQSAFLIGAAVPSAFVLWIASAEGIAFFEELGIQPLFGSWAGTARQGYLLFAATFGVIMVASIWATFFGTRERGDKRQKLPGNENPEASPLDYASSIIEELQVNRPFRIAVMLFLVTNCAATFIAVNLTFFIEYVLGMRQEQWVIFLILFTSAIIVMPGWVLLAKKYGKGITYRYGMFAYCLVLCGLPFVGIRNVFMAYSFAAMAGVFHAAALMLPWAIIPDVVEHDELKTGKRREGLFYGGTTFSYKLATGLAVFVSGVMLEQVGYIANEVQTETAVLGIKILVGPLPAALLLCGALLSLKYPLTEAVHRRIVAELVNKRGTLTQENERKS